MKTCDEPYDCDYRLTRQVSGGNHIKVCTLEGECIKKPIAMSDHNNCQYRDQCPFMEVEKRNESTRKAIAETEQSISDIDMLLCDKAVIIGVKGYAVNVQYESRNYDVIQVFLKAEKERLQKHIEWLKNRFQKVEIR